jgi:hypothetical protein
MINFKSYIINIFLLIILFTPVLSQFTEKSLIINYPKQEYQADNQNWSVAINTQGFVFLPIMKVCLNLTARNGCCGKCLIIWESDLLLYHQMIEFM